MILKREFLLLLFVVHTMISSWKLITCVQIQHSLNNIFYFFHIQSWIETPSLSLLFRETETTFGYTHNFSFKNCWSLCPVWLYKHFCHIIYSRFDLCAIFFLCLIYLCVLVKKIQVPARVRAGILQAEIRGMWKQNTAKITP